MRAFLKRNAPPGQNIFYGLKWFFRGLVAVLLFSLTFFFRYAEAYQELFEYTGAEKVLMSDAVIRPFEDILGSSLVGFWLLGICMLQFIFYHGYYFYQGSKSIYLMKRLPQRGLLAKYIFTLPVLAFVVCMLILFILRLLYFEVYLLFTPDRCLPAHVWQQFWR